MEEKKGLSKYFWLLVIFIFILLVGFVIFAFIMNSRIKPDVVEKTKNGGDIQLNYSSSKNVFTLTDINPITDDAGIKLFEEGKYYDFSVSYNIKDASKFEYEIYLKKDSKLSTISDDDIRIYLEKESSGSYNSVLKPTKFISLKQDSKLGTKKGNMIIVKDNVSSTGKKNYRLRMWLSNTSMMVIGNYSVEVNIKAVAK